MSALHGVLVTYRRGEQLADYLAALAAQTRQLDTLVVVDNDVEGSARWVLDRHGLATTKVDYLVTGDNTGPAGGIALGMRHVLTHAAADDWIVTLDDDDPPRTSELVEELARFGEALRDDDPTVGGVGLCGGRFDVGRGRFLTVADGELSGPVRSSHVGGGQFPCYSVRAVRSVGVFDASLFFGFEELDYGLRMYDHGFALYAHGDLWGREREHHGRSNTQLVPDRRLRDLSWRRYYSLRNLIFIMRYRRPLVAARLSLLNLAKPLYNLPRAPRLAAEHFFLNARAIVDAYRGRMGRTLNPAAKSNGRPR